MAQSTEAARYYLNGVCIQPHADGATMVATDGHMLLAAITTKAKA
jgi:DNA polymerase III sliding clamp (beta) subunit (PCNA family)